MPDLKKMLTLEALSEALPSWLKRSTKPEYNADEIDSTLTTNQFVTASDKDNWNAKGTYSKPSGGIPKSDLSSIVQTSLEKADSALQSETDPTVPSWAKQTNKPSYTQDEVADGSTYKRVTQTEKGTWSGKQNALTTTQMQAVNSGITSEGVAQIGKNQSNVTLLKNLNGRINYSSVTGFTESRTTSGFTIYYAFSETIPAGEYRIICDAALTDTIKADQFRLLYSLPATDDNILITPVVSNGHFVSNKITLPKPVVAFDLYTNTPTTISNFMIIDEATYQAGFRDYMPHSLPNTTITPALIDQVDTGAKNMFPNLGTASHGSVNFVWNADGTVTVSGTKTAGTECYVNVINNVPYGNLGLQAGDTLVFSNNNTNAYISVIFYKSDTGYTSSIIVQNESKEITLPRDKTNILVRLAVPAAATSVNVTIKPMMCTLADWKVSQKFVPHRPNYDLVISDVNKAVKLSRTLGSSDNFNLIVNTGFYKFTPTPQNAPVSCYGMLTVYQSENYISQILQSMHHGTSAGIFFRYSYDSGSTWEPWIGKIVSNTFSYTIPIANEYVAVSSVTLPPHSLSTITAAVQRYTSTGSQCLGIVLSTSTSSSGITYANTIAKKEQEPNMMDNLTVSATWLNSSNTSLTIHMYTKQNSTGIATITLINDMHGYK